MIYLLNGNDRVDPQLIVIIIRSNLIFLLSYVQLFQNTWRDIQMLDNEYRASGTSLSLAKSLFPYHFCHNSIVITSVHIKIYIDYYTIHSQSQSNFMQITYVEIEMKKLKFVYVRP